MRAFALLVLVMAMPGWAQARPTLATSPAPGRSWLTGLSVGLLGGGLAALVVGGTSAATAGELDHLISGYLLPGSDSPTKEAASTVKRLADRRDAATSVAVPMLISGAMLFAGGVISLIIETMWSNAAPQVGWASAPAGGVLTFSGHF